MRLPQSRSVPVSKHTAYASFLIGLGAIFSLLLIGGGSVLYRREIRSARNAELYTLHAIADLKSEQIAAWRRERLDDVGVGASGAIRFGIGQWIANDREDLWRQEILDTLETIRRGYRYQNAILASPEGEIWLTLDPRLNSDGCTYTTHMARTAAQSDAPILGDVFRCPYCRMMHIDAGAAIRDRHGETVAVLLLRSDPELFLFPVVERWPIPGRQARVFLVRQDDDGRTVLNLPSGATPAEYRLPDILGLSEEELPAEPDALLHPDGVREGQDSEGNPLFFAVRPVPDSPWIWIAAVNAEAVLADARQDARMIAILITLLILLTATGLGLYYKNVRKKAYASLYASERARREELEEFRITLYGIGDGVISGDAEGRIRRMNAVAERLTGWSESDAAGRPVSEVFRIINEETRNPVENPAERVLREGGIAGLANHTLLIARDGTERPIADSGAAIRNEQDETFGFVLVFRDQTREREALRALQQEHENRNAILTAAPVGMLVVDENETVREANPAAEKMFGRSLDELKTRRCGDVIGCVHRTRHPDGCGKGETCLECALYNAIRAVLDGKGPVFNQDAAVWLSSNGESHRMWVQFNAAPLELDGTRHAILALHDVTEQRHVEEQLRQAQKMEAVGRLAGGVAHDFNNMLEVILGHAELALGLTNIPPSVREDLQEIEKAGKRSADLTRQLLAFARRQAISPRPLDLNDVVSGMLSMLRRLIGENLTIVWNPSDLNGPVEMDPAQVDQILANLVVNARDAVTDTGKIQIETRNATADDLEIEPRIEEYPEGYVVLSVRDNGRGIDPHILEHIFEPFFTTKGVGKGTGLGLATVYGIVRQNRGFIRVQSKPGEGSVFTLFLPRCKPPAPDSSETRKPPRAHGVETILLVEDEPAILALGKRTLERFGYSVLTAETPTAALDVLTSHPGRIDLLLTDLVMPDMNGRELSREALRMRPEIKVLYMSGYTANVIVHHGILEAGLSFLQKPFSARTLAQKIREALDA